MSNPKWAKPNNPRNQGHARNVSTVQPLSLHLQFSPRHRLVITISFQNYQKLYYLSLYLYLSQFIHALFIVNNTDF